MGLGDLLSSWPDCLLTGPVWGGAGSDKSQGECTGTADRMTCHQKPGGMRNFHRDTLPFLIMFMEGSRRCFHSTITHQQRHSTLKTDVHSAITVTSWANEDVILGNYTPICVLVETKAACILLPRLEDLDTVTLLPTMAKEDKRIALWHCLLWQLVEWEITT